MIDAIIFSLLLIWLLMMLAGVFTVAKFLSEIKTELRRLDAHSLRNQRFVDSPLDRLRKAT